MANHNPILPVAYELMFLQMESPAFIFDADGKLVMLNRQAELILDAGLTMLQGATLEQLMHTFSLEVTLDDVPENPVPVVIEGETEFYEFDVMPLPDKHGQLVIMRDVTATVTRHQDFSEFAHTMGHDVKSPLGVAVGYASMMQTELEKGTEHRFFVDEIFNTAMRIMNICNELVLLADLDHLTMVEKMPANITDVLNNAIRRFPNELEQITLNTNVADNLPLVMGNPPWIEEIIADFFKFAVRENHNTTTITVDISLTDNEMIKFVLHHDGTNRPITYKYVLFPETFDIESIRAEGYGLGLPVARQLVETMGGDVGVTDDQSAIYFTLPIVNE